MQVIIVTDDDRQYARTKYEQTLAKYGAEAAEKYRQQWKRLEDAVIIYREARVGTPNVKTTI